MDNEITLRLTRDLVLRLWGTVPMSTTFGTPDSVQQCAQQPDMFMLRRKKKAVVFSVRSFKVIPGTPSPVLGWQEVQ